MAAAPAQRLIQDAPSDWREEIEKWDRTIKGIITQPHFTDAMREIVQQKVAMLSDKRLDEPDEELKSKAEELKNIARILTNPSTVVILRNIATMLPMGATMSKEERSENKGRLGRIGTLHLLNLFGRLDNGVGMIRLEELNLAIQKFKGSLERGAISSDKEFGDLAGIIDGTDAERKSAAPAAAEVKQRSEVASEPAPKSTWEKIVEESAMKLKGSLKALGVGADGCDLGVQAFVALLGKVDETEDFTAISIKEAALEEHARLLSEVFVAAFGDQNLIEKFETLLRMVLSNTPVLPIMGDVLAGAYNSMHGDGMVLFDYIDAYMRRFGPQVHFMYETADERYGKSIAGFVRENCNEAREAARASGLERKT